MEEYKNVKTNETITESDFENPVKSKEIMKIQEALKEMKKFIHMPERQVPRIFGKTVVLCRLNKNALFTIGPHIGFTA